MVTGLNHFFKQGDIGGNRNLGQVGQRILHGEELADQVSQKVKGKINAIVLYVLGWAMLYAPVANQPRPSWERYIFASTAS